MNSKNFYFLLVIISTLILFTGNSEIQNKELKYTSTSENFNVKAPYTLQYSDSIVQITDVFTGIASLYDYQSHSAPQHLIQRHTYPLSKDTFQAVFMVNMAPGIPSVMRRCYYLISTNTGLNWINKGEVPVGVASGWPAIDLFSDGRAAILNHSAVNSQSQHSVVFIESSPLSGNFQLCDPGLDSGQLFTKLWPKLVVTASNKVSFIASGDFGESNVLTNSSGCVFSGWQIHNDISNAEKYCIAKSSDGKIGVAYFRYWDQGDSTSKFGDVRFIESTDEGITWGEPVTIFDAQHNPDKFLGAFRGIDLVYIGSTPKVVFDIAWINELNFFPRLSGKIMFWSPDINGGNPVVVADSTNTPCIPVTGINNGQTPICRGSIGKSRDEQVLFVSYSVCRPEMHLPDSTHYFDVYLAWSADRGATWQGFKKITNNSGPVRDCQFSNIAPVNDNDENNYYVNLEYQKDSIPGSAISGASESPAEQHFLRVKLLNLIGIKNPAANSPVSFCLYQNYPNPFNPLTKIKFDTPPLPSPKGREQLVRLLIYDILGREITVLINEELKPGTYEVEWDASGFPSGVYFYMLETDKFKATKKMVLIK